MPLFCIILGLHPYLPFLSPWVEYFDSRQKITGVNNLAEGIPFQAEGEYFGKSPANFSIIPGAIDAIYKRKSDLSSKESVQQAIVKFKY